MAGATRGRPSKPLERKRRTGRSPGRDAGGRKLPAPADTAAVTGSEQASNLVVLPGTEERIPPAPATLKSKDRARTCPDAVLYPEDENGVRVCPVCLEQPGLDLWQELWREGRTWLSTRSDAHLLLAQLCEGRDEERHHQAVLEVSGRYVKGQRGGVVAHPAVRMLRQVRAEMVRAGALLGFSPSDRSRLGVGEVKAQKSALELLLERKLGSSGR